MPPLCAKLEEAISNSTVASAARLWRGRYSVTDHSENKNHKVGCDDGRPLNPSDLFDL
jgi:hypothetical protein